MVVEVIQKNNEIEPSFDVWTRTFEFVYDNEKKGIFLRPVRKHLLTSKSIPPPVRWPIPANATSNLSQELSWYFEKFSEQPTPATQRQADYFLKALGDWGEEVFQQLFSTNDAKSIYKEVHDTSQSNFSRIEIHSPDPTVLAWPWEAMIDNNNKYVGIPIAIERHYIFDSKAETAFPLEFFDKEGLNILLVTARAQHDVDYRIIGRSVLATHQAPINLNMVRPASLEHLKDTLQNSEKKWDILHLDCHGGYNSLFGSPPQSYIQLDDGLGQLTHVTADQLLEALGSWCPRHIVLNACRSAMATNSPASLTSSSLATTLLRHPNVEDVTAMAYNLSVDAAIPFFSSFYYWFTGNYKASTAVQRGRHSMIKDPYRTCINGTVVFEDWMIPVIYKRSLNLNSSQIVEYDTEQEKNTNWENRSEKDFYNHEAFIGRDNIIYILDRCADLPIKFWLVHGKIGIGKTCLLREFEWWRKKSGDPRPFVRIDTELIKGIDDLFLTIAHQLINPPPATISLRAIEEYILSAFQNCKYWILWDHLHVLRSVEAGNPNPSFSQDDINRLKKFFNRLNECTSTIIAASRGPEPWIEELIYCKKIPLGGLSDDERWQLASYTFKEERNQLKLPINGTVKYEKSLSKLVFYLAGHPTMTIECLSRFKKGESADNLLEMLRKTAEGLFPFSQDRKSGVRLQQTLRVLENDHVKKILPFLTLFEEIVDYQLLRFMMKKIVSYQTSNIIDQAFLILETAGLLTMRTFLHPALGGILRSNRLILVDEKHLKAFVSAFSPNNYLKIVSYKSTKLDKKPKIIISLGTYQNALDIAIGLGLIDTVLNLRNEIFKLYIDKHDFENALTFLDYMYESYMKMNFFNYAYSEALDSLRIARENRNHAEVEKWFGRVNNEIFKKDSTPSMKARYHLEIGVTQEAKNNFELFKENIQKAYELLPEVSDPELINWINFQMVQVAALSNTPVSENFSSNLEEIESSTSINSAILRTRALEKISEGSLNEAKYYLKQAIAKSKHEGYPQNVAMNISLLGEVEAKTNNLNRAVELFREAIFKFEEINDLNSAGITYHQMAKYYHLAGYWEEAGENFINSAVAFQNESNSYHLTMVIKNFDTYLHEINNAGFASDMYLRWFRAGLPIDSIKNDALIQSMKSLKKKS